MDKIQLKINNNKIILEIEELNILIENIFLNNDYKNLILILESINYNNKIIFLKNNIKNFNKILELSYLIHLSINKQIYFSYNKINMLSIYFNLNLQINKNKRYPNYSLKINNKNFLILKKVDKFLFPIINYLKINENDLSLNIINKEYNIKESLILKNIKSNILINNCLIEYFLFIDNIIYYIKKINYYKDRFNNIINVNLETIIIDPIFFYD
tara:strand:- start:17 stop:658 length:642 start_codon:yes stop_codon:yes gene_type:complete